MVGDHTAVTLGDENSLLVRVGKDGMDVALARSARRMETDSRTMNRFVVVAADRFEDDADLDAWISAGVGVATSLPPKGGSPQRTPTGPYGSPVATGALQSSTTAATPTRTGISPIRPYDSGTIVS